MIKIELEGDPTELEKLSRLSDALGHAITQGETGVWFLSSPDFDDLPDVSAIRDYAAETLLPMLLARGASNEVVEWGGSIRLGSRVHGPDRNRAILGGTARATAEAHSGGVKAGTYLWLLWSEIALTHLRGCRDQRSLGLALRRERPDESHLISAALGQETRQAMVTVSAASHAIDGFYGYTKRYIAVPDLLAKAWDRNGTPRWNRILQTFKLGFNIGQKGHGWQPEFEWLFDLRDAAVHAQFEMRDLYPHPTGTNAAFENVEYSNESAHRAVALLVDVLENCQNMPKPIHQELVSQMQRLAAAMNDIRRSFNEISEDSPPKGSLTSSDTQL